MARTIGTSNATLAYNGYTFPPQYNATVSATPIYDSANRVRKYVNYSITIETFLTSDDFPGTESIPSVAPGSPIDAAAVILRRRLSEPGREFTFINQGFGADFTIDHSKTVDYGPKPEIISWKNVAGSKAIHLVWRINCMVIECRTGAVGTAAKILGEFTFAVNWNINEEGLTTRAITGTMEVYSRRAAAGSLTTTGVADAYRNLIKFSPVMGFRRTQSYTLTPDRRFLQFSITDTEINSPSAYPAHVTSISARYSLSGKAYTNARTPGKLMSAGFWQMSLSGHVTLAPGKPKTLAWLAIAYMLQERWRYAAQGRGATFTSGGKSFADRNSFILGMIDFTISTGLYNRTVQFQFKWVLCSSLRTLLKSSAIFQPIEGQDWGTWKTSLGDLYQPSGRGHAGMQFLKNDDVLVGFCETEPREDRYYQYEQDEKQGSGFLDYDVPSEENSWIAYYYSTSVTDKPESVMHLIAGSKNYSHPGGYEDADGFVVDNGRLESPNDDGVVRNISYTRSAGEQYIILQGQCSRLRYPIQPQHLVYIQSIGGVDAADLRVYSAIDLPGPDGGTVDSPIFSARWIHIYKLPYLGRNNVKVSELPHGAKNIFQPQQQ